MSPGTAVLATRAGLAGRSGLARRPVAVAVAGLGLLAVALVAGIAAGTVAIPPGETLAILGRRILGLDIVPTWAPAAETIVIDLRLPRVLTAMVVGGGLAVAGATFQGLLRNPLADPYVLGTASGAALGAALAVLIPVRLLVLEFGLLHGLAFLGALGAVLVVYKLSQAGAGSPMTSLLLTGYAVSSLLAAGLAMAMYLSGAGLRQIFAYLLGGFDASSWGRLAVAAPLIALAVAGDRACGRGRSTGCSSARRRPRTSASTSGANGRSSSRSPRWPRRPRSPSPVSSGSSGSSRRTSSGSSSARMRDSSFRLRRCSGRA